MTGDSTFGLLAIVAFLGLLPLLAVTVTAFAKISVVFFIVRNALGIQQLPPNIIVYALSVILSVYIAMPTLEKSYFAVRDSQLSFKSFADFEEAGAKAAQPFREFLSRHTDRNQQGFFLQSTAKLWGEDRFSKASENDLAILVPSFLLSELTRAFEVGFLLYLPFMAIDIIVTTVLMALGMMQISPTTIAIPFKLMLFVFIDGWTKMVQGLVLSYL